MPARGIGWVVESPGDAPGGQPKSLYNETGARRRRLHQKSRKGCTNCKQRRVKCDERHPICEHCEERGWCCVYPSGNATSGSGSRHRGLASSPAQSPTLSESERQEDARSPTPDRTGLEVGSRPWKHAQLLACLERVNVPRQQPGEHSVYQRTDALELMDHFEDCSEPWLGSPTAQSMIQAYGIQQGLQSPYLLHAILAYSASHLGHLHPDEKKYGEAARTHFTRSLQAYSTELVYELERGNANALLAASGLLAKLSFINTPVLSGDAASPPATVPPWVRSMQGVRTIMCTPALRKQLLSGPYKKVGEFYFGHVDPSSAATSTLEPLSEPARLMNLLKKSCGLVGDFAATTNTTTTTANWKLYAAALARLEAVMLTDLTHDSVDQMLSFIGTLEPSFLDLLAAGDERALLILAFWCARLGRIAQWWTRPSAVAECRRISAILAKSPDPEVQVLRAFPAAFCGYEGRAREQLPSPPSEEG